MSEFEVELDPRETALCTFLDSATRKAFGERLDGNPLYEVHWQGIKKKTEWKPALSLIPVKREKTYGVNINILQRFKIKGVDNETYAIYSAVTPRDDKAVFLGVDLAMLEKYSVPRGLMFTVKGIKPVERDGDPESGRIRYTTPLHTAIKTEFAHKKQSRLINQFNELLDAGQYDRFKLTSSKYFVVGPLSGQTLILCSSYVNPLKGPKQQFQIDGGKMKIQFGVPDPKEIRKTLNFLLMLSDYVRVYAVDADVGSSIPNMGLPSLLMGLEAARRENFPEGPPVHLGEIFGTIDSPRREELTKLALGMSSSEEEDDTQPTKETTDEPVKDMHKHRCPDCNRVAVYNYAARMRDGSLICTHCRGKFLPAPDNEVK